MTATDEIAEAVDAVRVVSHQRYEVLGTPYLVDAVSARISSLTQALYQDLYTRQDRAGRRRFDLGAEREHVARLSAANCGHGTWDPGWTLQHVEDGRHFAVRKRGLTFWTTPRRVRPADSPPDVRPGDQVRVRVEKELGDLDGFYMALGDGAADLLSDDVVVRFYWNLRAEAAVPFVRALTARLNPTGLPYQVKVLRDPGGYFRADAGVLYLKKRYYEDVHGILAGVFQEVRDDLRPAVPLFTRCLAPGLGVAEDPGDLESFGLHRCGLVARAIWEAFDGETAARERCAEIFREEDLDPKRPHLAAGESDIYRDFVVGQAVPAAACPATKSNPTTDTEEMAALVGEVLCRQAFWHDGRCAWLGRSQGEAQSGRLEPTVTTLGPSLYRGTAGVALFLARLGAALDAAKHRRTALGAIRQALHQTWQREHRRRGWWSGELGVAWAAHHVADLVKDEELAEAARDLTAEILADLDGPHRLDVLDGNAGAIPALLDLAARTTSSGYLEEAVILGHEIRDAARIEGEAWSWDTERASGGMGPRPLAGFSHGAAGMGLALLELYAVTGEEAFRAGARGAFAYEAGLFDSTRKNWPDLQAVPPRSRRRPSYPVSWCHGAAGIALSRLRAAALDKENAEDYRAVAAVGVETTLESLRDLVAADGADTCLCHGATGLVETLIEASTILGEDHLSAARDAMGTFWERYGADGPWPSGVPSRGANPSLMIGLAGVGYTLLRLHDPGLHPSVLRLDPALPGRS